MNVNDKDKTKTLLYLNSTTYFVLYIAICSINAYLFLPKLWQLQVQKAGVKSMTTFKVMFVKTKFVVAK